VAGTKVTGHGDVGASLVLIFPLLLAYEIGVLFAGHVNGADVVTRALYATLASRTAYLVFHAALAIGFLIWIRRTRQGHTLRLGVALPVIAEAACYALALRGLVGLVLEYVPGLGAGDTIISAAGAGVHEELLFRLGLMCALVHMLQHRRAAVPIALAISSPLFALAHHVGPGGQPFTVHAFAFRTLAGAAFGAIYWYRSLAHAVYAHTIYDLLVLL